MRTLKRERMMRLRCWEWMEFPTVLLEEQQLISIVCPKRNRTSARCRVALQASTIRLEPRCHVDTLCDSKWYLFRKKKNNKARCP